MCGSKGMAHEAEQKNIFVTVTDSCAPEQILVLLNHPENMVGEAGIWFVSVRPITTAVNVSPFGADK